MGLQGYLLPHTGAFLGSSCRQIPHRLIAVSPSCIRFARECEIRITGFRASFLPDVPTGRAHRTCLPDVPAGRACRTCPPDVPTGRARRTCLPDVPAGRARRTCPPDVPTGRAHRTCPPDVPAGRACLTCPPDHNPAAAVRSAASTRPAWILIHAAHSQEIGQRLAPQNQLCE